MTEQNGKEQTTLTTTTDATDELGAFTQAAAANLHVNAGTLLTYKKGKFVYGKDKIVLPLGTELVALMNEVRHGHDKWINGQIVDRAIGRVVDRFVVNRDILGDLDESEWPYRDGKQSDPWVHTVYIPMVTRDAGTLFTFSTHSFYGREAAYGLLKNYGAEARLHVGCYPVIRLGTTINKSKKYGDIDSPTLEIVDWQDKPQHALALTSIPDEVDDKPKPKPKSSGFGNSDMDDDIPF